MVHIKKKKKSWKKRKNKIHEVTSGMENAHMCKHGAGRFCKESKQLAEGVCVYRKEICWNDKAKICECLHHMGAYHCGPVSDFVLKEMGDYWEIYPREWQELVHLQSLGCFISAEHRTGILIPTRLCAHTQGNRKDPTVIRRKKMPPDSEQVTSPSWTSAPPPTTKNLGPTLSKYLLNHWR